MEPIGQGVNTTVTKMLSIWDKYRVTLKLPESAYSGMNINLPQYIKDSYSRFVENQMRQMYDLSGVPIDLFWRKSS
jgi:GTP-binding protein